MKPAAICKKPGARLTTIAMVSEHILAGGALDGSVSLWVRTQIRTNPTPRGAYPLRLGVPFGYMPIRRRFSSHPTLAQWPD